MNSLPAAQSFPMGSTERMAISAAYTDAFRVVLQISLIALAIGVLISVLMSNIRIDAGEHSRFAEECTQDGRARQSGHAETKGY